MADHPLKLYTYWRSSAAYRVRIGLNLKDLSAAMVPVHLVKDGGEQHSDAYRSVNPHELVPALAVDGEVITNSLAILEYLEEQYPEQPILPKDFMGRARVRQIAQAIAVDIHPLQNLRVLQFVAKESEDKTAAMFDWARHWITIGFDGLERQLQSEDATGLYCHGSEPTMADICLVPQMANARRFEVDFNRYPKLCEINERARALPAFVAAEPANQPDAE
jgi:maleylacetoacetate isomerase